MRPDRSPVAHLCNRCLGLLRQFQCFTTVYNLFPRCHGWSPQLYVVFPNASRLSSLSRVFLLCQQVFCWCMRHLCRHGAHAQRLAGQRIRTFGPAQIARPCIQKEAAAACERHMIAPNEIPGQISMSQGHGSVFLFFTPLVIWDALRAARNASVPKFWRLQEFQRNRNLEIGGH